MTITSRKSKRKFQQEPPPQITVKKLRSKLPRRRRRQISPVILASAKINVSGHSVDFGSCSDFAAGEASCDSSRASVVFAGNQKCSNSSKRSPCELSRNRRFEKRNESEVSESSCVDSNSGVHERSRSLILKFRSGKESGNPNENKEFSEACTNSVVTFEERFPGENSKSGNGNLKISSEKRNRNDVVSVSSSGVLATSFKDEKTTCKGKRASEFELSQGSRNRHDDENCADLIPQSTIVKQWQNDSDLACTEQFQFSYYNDEDEESEYSSSQGTAFSDLRSEIFSFPECSELELSDYTPSLFIESGSQFSQGSVGETPSPTHSLFLQFRNEFSMLTSPFDHASSVEDEVPAQAKLARFEDLYEEESYQMLRERERKQVFLWNYAERYSSTKEFGDHVIQQRSQMVHWIVEQSYRKQLRQETMFLGVSLLDRFLSKGYFKTKRNLQIVGVACLTLATRIEENQQYSRVGQKCFYIGSSVYSRCEVVAMEWVVLEVLKFQCFLPTIYNFLWFYLKAAKAGAAVEKRVKYLGVLALSAHEQLCYWPSTVAAALVILACLEVDQKASHKVIGIHVRSKDENLHECMESLEWLLRYL